MLCTELVVARTVVETNLVSFENEVILRQTKVVSKQTLLSLILMFDEPSSGAFL